jgi:hypothetical protein
MSVIIKIIFWNFIPCSLVDLEAEGNMFLQNVSEHVPDCLVSHLNNTVIFRSISETLQKTESGPSIPMTQLSINIYNKTEQTPRYSLFLEKLIITQLIKKFPAFIEPKFHECVQIQAYSV